MIHPDEIALTVMRTLSLQSFYSLALFPVIWGLVRCSRGQYPQWQHGLWFLILIRLVMPPDTAFNWSAGNLILSYSPKIISGSQISGPLSDGSNALFKVPGNQDTSAIRFGNGSPPDRQHTSEKGRIPERQNTRSFPLFSLSSFCMFTFCTWLIITTTLIWRFLKNRHGYRKRALNGKKIITPDVLHLAEVWKRRLSISRKIRLRSDASNGPPFTTGLLRPIVVLPRHLLCSPEKSVLETVLAHELVHVKRWDDLFILIQEILRIVYFFNPVVWYIIPRLTWTREAACDSGVLSYGTISPKRYSKNIIRFLKTRPVQARQCRNLAGFTPAARGIAFRLRSIQKEENMKSNPVKNYFALVLLGLFILPMSPVISSGQNNTEESKPAVLPKTQEKVLHKTPENPLIRFILDSVQCRNPEEIAFILWGDKISETFQKEDFHRLAAATDFDIVEDMGNGRKAYIFYLLDNSRQGVHRQNFHFIKTQNKLFLVYKSQNVSVYDTESPQINGHYQIVEGWRADLVNDEYDDRVKLAWGSRLWFWTGDKYIPAFTDYHVKDATDPSLTGIKREWNLENRFLYDAASRQ